MAKKFSVFSFACFLFISASMSQIPVHINSGNPTFPFPRFLSYENSSGILNNLGTHNPQGVTHAEMEQAIRDAYQIMMNRAVKPGGGVGGIDYIYFKSNPNCSEGDGYALLGAVAMADKETFDGLWLWIHDNAMNKVKRYNDCQESSPGYNYSRLPAWTNEAGDNSATDGDVDIGFALLCAYYQWGEFMGINDSCGNPISYKYEAIEFLKGMTDTLLYSVTGSTLISGDIGLDGYFKSGDTWQELTDWGSDIATNGFTHPTEHRGPQSQYFDYIAPSYFKVFADFLASEDSATYAWNIYQFRRAEASSDWLMGELYKADPRNIPICGNVSLTGTTPQFRYTGNMGEDFRLAWRTILNRMWHGNPTYSWNPTTHQVDQDIPNNYLQNIAHRFARFIWDSRQSPWEQPCAVRANKDFTYWGPISLQTDLDMVGVGGGYFYLNWMPAVGSFSSVISQDYNLMAELYRQLDIEWDVETPGDGYLSSVPFYYHGWYRLLGLLVLSGNYQAPNTIKPIANLKVYLDVDKTVACRNDQLNYTISYRNFGSLDAQDVVIVDTLHPDLSFNSCTGGGVYDKSSHCVLWKIGGVDGFNSNSVPSTSGNVQLNVSIAGATVKQYRNKAVISCSNGTGWVSNEYPNHISSIMKRNYVDVVSNSLSTIDTLTAVPNLHGGRAGVHFSFIRGNDPAQSPTQEFTFKLFHDAHEAYINYENYRFSYFIYDEKHNGLQELTTSKAGWSLNSMVVEGVPKEKVTILHQNLLPGSDTNGKWNQRIIIQFTDSVPSDTNWATMGTIESHLTYYRVMRRRIHRGVRTPLRVQFLIASKDWKNVDWGDDWSWSSAVSAENSTLEGYPISPEFTDPTPDNTGRSVMKLNPKHCEDSQRNVENIMVEEWDGYRWRRVAGNVPGAQVEVSRVNVSRFNDISLNVVNRKSLQYTLPHAMDVSLLIYDLHGRVLEKLVDSHTQSGVHTVTWNNVKYGAGSYIACLKAGKRLLFRQLYHLK